MAADQLKFLDKIGLSHFWDNLTSLLSTKADTDSPAFTGTPTAPNPESGDASTQIATTKYVQDEIAAIADNPEIPYDYRILEYIDGTGGAWIDTGVVLNNALSFEMEMSLEAGRISAAMVAHNSTSLRQGFMLFNTASHKIDYFWTGVEYKTLSVNSAINFAEKVRISQDKNGIYISQGAYTDQASYTGKDMSDASTVEILHSQNPNHEAYNFGRVYAARIARGDDSLRDFVPVQNKTTNEVGLYDKVFGHFYGSMGSSKFLAGPIVDENEKGSGGGGRSETGLIIVRDMTSTSITLDVAKKNTLYRYGTLTALNVTEVESGGVTGVIFTSGNPATTVTLPSTLVLPLDYEIKADTTYELNILDGEFLTLGEW